MRQRFSSVKTTAGDRVSSRHSCWYLVLRARRLRHASGPSISIAAQTEQLDRSGSSCALWKNRPETGPSQNPSNTSFLPCPVVDARWALNSEPYWMMPLNTSTTAATSNPHMSRDLSLNVFRKLWIGSGGSFRYFGCALD